MTIDQLSAETPVLQDLTDGGPGAPALTGAAAESVQPLPSLGGDCQETIRQTVARLLQEKQRHKDRRWVPREQYVRSARVHFKEPQSRKGEEDRTVLVATTDLSFEGAGILSWQKIPVRHVVLRLAGVRFACNVRWRQVLGGRIHRYGLHFYKVLDKPVHGKPRKS